MPRTRSNSSANKQKGVAAAACSAPGPDEGQNISSRSRANSNAPPPPLAGPSIPLKLAWRIQGKHVLIAGGGTRMPPILSTLLVGSGWRVGRPKNIY